MERNQNKTLYKILLIALRTIPMLLAVCEMLNMLFDFFGVNTRILSLIGGVSILPLSFLYLASYVFRFCEYHRMFLHYVLANNILVYFDFYIGIPVEDKHLFMIHIVLVGIFLFLILYFYRREKCFRQSRKSCLVS